MLGPLLAEHVALLHQQPAGEVELGEVAVQCLKLFVGDGKHHGGLQQLQVFGRRLLGKKAHDGNHEVAGLHKPRRNLAAVQQRVAPHQAGFEEIYPPCHLVRPEQQVLSG